MRQLSSKLLLELIPLQVPNYKQGVASKQVIRIGTTPSRIKGFEGLIASDWPLGVRWMCQGISLLGNAWVDIIVNTSIYASFIGHQAKKTSFLSTLFSFPMDVIPTSPGFYGAGNYLTSLINLYTLLFWPIGH